jgi:surface antigen
VARFRTPTFIVAAATVAACIGLASPANAGPVRSAAKACSTSATPPVSKYDRTPAGSGPWQVPFDSCNYEGRAMGDSSTPYGDCTYWAAEKRPDVFYGPVNKYGYKQAPYGAWNVAVDAQKGGYRVDHTPQVGEIAAWKSNAIMGQSPDDGTWYQAANGGHLSYVEAVNGPVITLSEMGHPGNSSGGFTFRLTYDKSTYFIHKP